MAPSLPYNEQLEPLTGALIFAVIIISFLFVLHFDKVKNTAKKVYSFLF